MVDSLEKLELSEEDFPQEQVNQKARAWYSDIAHYEFWLFSHR